MATTTCPHPSPISALEDWYRREVPSTEISKARGGYEVRRRIRHNSIKRSYEDKTLAARRRKIYDEAIALCHVEERSAGRDPELQAEIKRAEAILELANDWDDEGSVAYSQDTFDRAVNFLTSHSTKLYEQCKLRPPVPKIGPGPNGSIDLHWKNDDWELLVNIPEDVHQPASFYGDDYGIQKIKGSLNPESINLGIVTWLMRH